MSSTCPFCQLRHNPEKSHCNDPHTGALIRRRGPVEANSVPSGSKSDAASSNPNPADVCGEKPWTVESVISVQPKWCLALPLQQQSVLFLAARGPDGIAKAHPCKNIQRAYRGTVLVAAKYGRCLKWGEKADSFMSLELMTKMEEWERLINLFFEHADDLPHHFLMHLMHGAEIIGYKHPDERFRIRWKAFYFRAVKELHLTEESMEEMDARLSDWGRKHWEAPSAHSA